MSEEPSERFVRSWHDDRHRLSPRQSSIMRLCLSLVLITVVGCSAGATSSPPGSSEPLTSPPAATGAIATATPSTSPVASSSTSAVGSSATTCVLPSQAADWIPIPPGVGRCMAPAFDPPLSFAPGAGWLWSPNNLGFALTRDNGLTFLAVYRYGGAVVPHYCVDPPKTIATRAAADVVAWVKTVPGLQAKVTDRKVGTHRAWQLDLYAANPAGCAKDKVGLAALWTVAGADVNAPEVLGGGDRLRAYLIEVPTGIVVITVSAHQMSSKSYNQFLVDSDRLFSSLAM